MTSAAPSFLMPIPALPVAPFGALLNFGDANFFGVETVPIRSYV
jgi:hypothetical protein